MIQAKNSKPTTPSMLTDLLRKKHGDVLSHAESALDSIERLIDAEGMVYPSASARAHMGHAINHVRAVRDAMNTIEAADRMVVADQAHFEPQIPDTADDRTGDAHNPHNAAKQQERPMSTMKRAASAVATAAAHGAKVAAATEVAGHLLAEFTRLTNMPESVQTWLSTPEGQAVGTAMIATLVVTACESGHMPMSMARQATAGAELVLEGAAAKIVGPLMAKAMPHITSLAKIGATMAIAEETDDEPATRRGELPLEQTSRPRTVADDLTPALRQSKPTETREEDPDEIPF